MRVGPRDGPTPIAAAGVKQAEGTQRIVIEGGTTIRRAGQPVAVDQGLVRDSGRHRAAG